MKKIEDSLVPAVLWLLVSIILLTLPGSAIPKEDWLDKIGFDKCVHIIMFGIMVILWCRVPLKLDFSSRKLKISFLWIAVAALAFGIGMEFVQKYFVPGRSCDVRDMLADAVGCAAGFFFCTRRFIKK
ncbi:MAG: VanZ family protein [Chitinophagales bacterium]